MKFVLADKKENRLSKFLKRLFDLVGGLGLLVLLLPVFLVVSVIILFDDGTPIFFRQKRVGRGGKLFQILKFRSMRKNAPNCATSQLAAPHRFITRSGNLLRRTSLDELPQLLNIVFGQMSFVGPRPLIPEEGEIHRLRSAYGVYRMQPGITGLAQVSGRDLVSDREKARLDAEYVNRHSLRLDFRILLKTVLVVLKAEGIQEGRSPQPHPTYKEA